MPKLTVTKEGVEVQSVDLEALGHPLTLGRNEACDVHLEGRAIGREHAVILIQTQGISIQKKSKFGKLAINGAEVEESSLKPGDVVSIADYQLRLEETKKIQKIMQEEGPSLEEIPPEPVETLEAKTTQPVSSVELSAEPSKEVPVTPELDLPQETPGTPAATTDAGADSIQSLEIASEPVVASDAGERTMVAPLVAVVTQLVFKPGEANVEAYEIKKPEISIGRGAECDVILNDPKASRKHALIKRAGLSFFAQDLGSGNGTQVNGEQITEKELAGDDKLRIGDTEFIFKALNQEYFEKQQEFIQVPSQEETPPPAQAETPEVVALSGISADQVAMVAGADAASAVQANIPGLAPVSKKKESLLAKFKRQPTPRKIMIVVGLFLILYFVFGEEDNTKNKPKTAQPGVQAGDASFKALPREKRQFVINTYQLAFDFYKNQEFEKALFEIKKVLDILPSGYKDARDIKLYAEKAIEIKKSQDEERRRKEEEEKIRTEVAALITQAQELINKGKDAEAKDVFTKILERDPENATVLRLKSEMEERDRQKKLEAERLADLANRKKQLENLIKQGRALLKEGKYYDVMEKMADAPTIGLDDKKLLGQAKSLITQAKHLLHVKTQPFLDEGKAALAQGNFTKARDAYFNALKVDSRNAEAEAGLQKIGEELHDRAKKIYTEAVIAEAVSDYKTAKDKYKKCLDQSMPDDIYYGRCSRKYLRFQMLNTANETGEEPSNSENKLSQPTSQKDPTEPVLPSEGESQ